MKKVDNNYNNLVEVARLMIRDYLYYGYGIKTFLEQDYDITKELGIHKIKELFKEQTEILGNE
ncbi:MAG: hypothetical protein J6A15_00065 [Clostridia bacterium]|nr:hypothetical protein [Clostridia bacterium]